VVLFGGTFAPPHIGHVHALETALDILAPDRVIVMPTGIPPHKVKVAGDTPELRYEMCCAAFGHFPKTEISDYEIMTGKISYTVNTLEHLSKNGQKIYLLCGSDMFLTLDKWFRAERIFELASIVGIPRNDGVGKLMLRKKEEYEKKYSAEVLLIGADPIEISSTDIRDMIKNGSRLDFLPIGVLEIIEREKLYYE